MQKLVINWKQERYNSDAIKERLQAKGETYPSDRKMHQYKAKDLSVIPI